jgi:hypothetical protein
MVSHVVNERGLESSSTVDNQNTASDCSSVIAMDMVMVRFKVPFSVLDGFPMLGHDGFQFDCDLSRRRSGAEDMLWGFT